MKTPKTQGSPTCHFISKRNNQSWKDFGSHLDNSRPPCDSPCHDGQGPNFPRILIDGKEEPRILSKLLANASWQKFGAALAAPLMFCVSLLQVSATAPQAGWLALPAQTSSPVILFQKVFMEELPLVRKLISQISPHQY